MAKKASKRNDRSNAVQIHNASAHASESQLDTLLGRLIARIDAFENRHEDAVDTSCAAPQSSGSVPQKTNGSDRSAQGVHSSILNLCNAADELEKLLTRVQETFASVIDVTAISMDSVPDIIFDQQRGGCSVSVEIDIQVIRINYSIQRLSELTNLARLG